MSWGVPDAASFVIHYDTPHGIKRSIIAPHVCCRLTTCYQLLRISMVNLPCHHLNCRSAVWIQRHDEDLDLVNAQRANGFSSPTHLLFEIFPSFCGNMVLFITILRLVVSLRPFCAKEIFLSMKWSNSVRAVNPKIMGTYFHPRQFNVHPQGQSTSFWLSYFSCCHFTVLHLQLQQLYLPCISQKIPWKQHESVIERMNQTNHRGEIYPHINVMWSCILQQFAPLLPCTRFFWIPNEILELSRNAPWLIWLFDCSSLTAILTSLKCNYANRSAVQGQSCTVGLSRACE